MVFWKNNRDKKKNKYMKKCLDCKSKAKDMKETYDENITLIKKYIKLGGDVEVKIYTNKAIRAEKSVNKWDDLTRRYGQMVDRLDDVVNERDYQNVLTNIVKDEKKINTEMINLRRDSEKKRAEYEIMNTTYQEKLKATEETDLSETEITQNGEAKALEEQLRSEVLKSQKTRTQTPQKKRRIKIKNR